METPQIDDENEHGAAEERTILKRPEAQRQDVGSTASIGQIVDGALGVVSRGPGLDAALVGKEESPAEQTDAQRHLSNPLVGSPDGISGNGSGDRPAEDSDEKAKTVIRRADAGSSVRNLPNPSPVTPADVAKVLLGSRLSHFELEELIGGGGMGAVFRARDERLDRTVAIKVIPFIGDDPDMQRRFRNEAQSAARLDHPNIARVYDVGMFDGWRYIVFEYIQGTNLRDLVAHEGVLSIDDAVFYTRQIAEALHHASGRGVVHRDVKPSNVLVNTDGDTKLVDMGLARTDQIDMSGDMTASGVTLGTFDYISPEQARDPRDADVRSDIYSLGCTLYFMLTGSPPYPGGTMLQKLLNHGNAPPPDPSGLRGGISDDLKAIINKMLAKSPDSRYQRAIDLVADLRELAAREGLVRAQTQGTLTINRDETAGGRLSPHLPWLVAASLLLIGAIVLQVTASLRDSAFVLENPASAIEMRRVSSEDLERMSRVLPNDGSNRSTAASNLIPSDSANNLGTVKPQESDPTARVMPTALLDSPSARVGPEASSNVDTPANAGDPKAPVTDLATLPPKYSDLALPRENAATPEMNKITSPTVVKVDKIVVGKQETPTNDPTSTKPENQGNVANAMSLSDAIQMATDFNVKVIEIAQPVIETLPIRIPNDAMTIRSAVGGTEIRFITGPMPAMQRAVMIDVGTNRVDFQNLHLSWNVRSASIDGGALIAVSDNRLVRLTDCTITIENLTQREEVYAFEITSVGPGRVDANLTPQDPLSLRIGNDSAGLGREIESPPGTIRPPLAPRTPVPPLVAIELNHVAIRGEVTMVNVVDPVQLQLRWDNGLLAVSRRMLEIAGVNVPQSAAGNQIQLVLNRVTASTGEGLVRTRLGPSGVYPMAIDRDSRNGVFRSSPDAALIEFSGLESIYENHDQLVNMRGEDNAYDYQPEFDWPLLSISGAGKREVYWMSQMISSQRPGWLTERSTRWVVRWSQPIDNTLPASRSRASHFFQDGTVVAGFDRNRLPDFPVESTENLSNIEADQADRD